jgi:hypothetical protein
MGHGAWRTKKQKLVSGYWLLCPVKVFIIPRFVGKRIIF